MAKHQHDKNANELWEYFQSVIAWVRKVFSNHRKEMANVNWGELYNQFKDKKLDAKKLETQVAKLMQDEDVTKKIRHLLFFTDGTREVSFNTRFQ
jgi:hypothetical protein